MPHDAGRRLHAICKIQDVGRVHRDAGTIEISYAKDLM
jgi:hypothetical protein